MRPAVSNMGRHRSYSGKISKGQLRKQDGRYYAGVTNAQGRNVTYVLARLVKLAFDGPPDDPTKIDVGHLDHDKTNNVLSNLEWQTHQQNMQQAMEDPNRSQTRLPISKQVLHRLRGATTWTTYPSSMALARALGYKSNGAVSEIANGNRKHSEHEVRYVEQPDLEGEEWRVAVGYPDVRVSNKGRIEYQTGKRDCGSDLTGYKAYHSKKGFIFMHALIMQTFVGPRPDGLDIDHVNGDTHNNCLTNLRYLTRKANLENREIDHGLAAKARGKPVLATKDGVTTRFESASDAARKLGLKQGTIAYNADHEKIHGGYLFAREQQVEIEGEEWCDLTEEVLEQAKRQLRVAVGQDRRR
ncbi:MAG: hypothetical protein CMN93_07700 [Synechococcus sp. CPC35]|nr:hypothetical protein [Synechococcus sp. CPC35]